MRRSLLHCLLVSLFALGAPHVLEVKAQQAGRTPPNRWINATGTLAGMASECGNLSLLSAVPGSDVIIAGVAKRGLFRNSPGSNAWVHLGTAAGSEAIVNRPTWITYDPARPGVFWESGSYGGGVYLTTDAGKTFRQLGSISHTDYVSVDFKDPDRQTLLAGGHEQPRTLHRSTDGGQTWTNIGLNLPANSDSSTHPLVVSAQVYLVNSSAVGNGSAGSIYRTTNGGAAWQRVAAVKPDGPPLMTLNGTIYWPANDGLLKSTDAGLTWRRVGRDVRPVHPIELADRSLVSIGPDYLIISTDGGSSWSEFGARLPYKPDGVIYSPVRRSFFVWKADCSATVPANAIIEIR